MFHIKSLELVHWDYWQRIKNIPLDAKIITIAGQNGSGKTTLLDALRTLFGLDCSMGRTYKHYARHSGQQSAWIRAVVDNKPSGRQLSNRPFRHSGFFSDDEVTLFCQVQKNGGDWKRQYLMRPGNIDDRGSHRSDRLAGRRELPQAPGVGRAVAGDVEGAGAGAGRDRQTVRIRAAPAARPGVPGVRRQGSAGRLRRSQAPPARHRVGTETLRGRTGNLAHQPRGPAPARGELPPVGRPEQGTPGAGRGSAAQPRIPRGARKGGADVSRALREAKKPLAAGRQPAGREAQRARGPAARADRGPAAGSPAGTGRQCAGRPPDAGQPQAQTAGKPARAEGPPAQAGRGCRRRHRRSVEPAGSQGSGAGQEEGRARGAGAKNRRANWRRSPPCRARARCRSRKPSARCAARCAMRASRTPCCPTSSK